MKYNEVPSACLVKFRKKKDGLHVTVWGATLRYFEDSEGFTLSKRVHRNEKKVSLAQYCKAANKHVPAIFFNEVVFWDGARTPAQHVKTSNIINNSISACIIDNREEAEEKVNTYAAPIFKKLKLEKWGYCIRIGNDGISMGSKKMHGGGYFYSYVINEDTISHLSSSLMEREKSFLDFQKKFPFKGLTK